MPRLARDCDGLPESAGWRAQGGKSGRPKPMTYITRNQRLGRDSNSHGRHPQSLMGGPGPVDSQYRAPVPMPSVPPATAVTEKQRSPSAVTVGPTINWSGVPPTPAQSRNWKQSQYSFLKSQNVGLGKAIPVHGSDLLSGSYIAPSIWASIC